MPTPDATEPDDEELLDDALGAGESDDALDDEFEPDPDDFDVAMEPRPPRPVSERMLGAAMVGLHGLIYGEKEQPAAVMQADGAPPNDDDIVVDLDPDDPSASRIVVRRRQP